MSWVDDITSNAIKVGQTLGICDTAELRKLKDENEKSKLEIEKKEREDAFAKNHSKTMKEIGEMHVTYEDAFAYCLAKMDDKDLLKMLESRNQKSEFKSEPQNNNDAEVEMPGNDH
jgi:hypothetical protein